MTVLNNIILLITWSRLSVAQASSTFNRLDACTPTHATPTFITEALRLVTHVIDSIPYGHGIGNSYIKVQPFKDTPHLDLNQHILRNNYM